MIRTVLIRHGRTAWNAGEGRGKRFRGEIDLPLTDEGIVQAQATAQRLAGLPVTAVYSSPLQRAARTAQIIADPHGLATETVPGLGSMDYGQWAGQFDADVARRWPELYRRWRRDPFSIQVPGGESTSDLRERAVAALRDILGHHSDGEIVALVSHQVTTRTLVSTLVGMPHAAWWYFGQDLCNLSCFDYEPGSERFTLVGLNDTCHLNPALPHIMGDGTRLILIRHGQTAWNLGAEEERFRGRTDLPLDDVGRAQARSVANRLKGEPIAALYASPLLRAQQTMMPLAETLVLPIRPHDGLLDINYGRFQGLTYSEAAVAYPERYTMWRTRPSRVRFPGGEGVADVQARLLALVEDMAARHPSQTVALVGHQVVNKILACTLLGLDLDQIWCIQQDTCALDVFQQAGEGWHTLRLNDTCHIPGAT